MGDDIIVDVSELNRLAVTIDNAAKTIGETGSAVVRKTALDIEATAKAFAPVDTGALRNSIGTDVHGDSASRVVEAVVGPTVEYGPYVEFGTSRMAPRAFMGPALDRHTPDFIAALEQVDQVAIGTGVAVEEQPRGGIEQSRDPG